MLCAVESPEDCCRVGWFRDVFNFVVNGHMYDVSEFGHHRDFELEHWERNLEVLGGWWLENFVGYGNCFAS